MSMEHVQPQVEGGINKYSRLNTNSSGIEAWLSEADKKVRELRKKMAQL